jgi:hypothetical protein
MGSAPEERHKQAAQACLLLQRIPTGLTPEERSYRAQELTKKIEELCALEIIRAVLGKWLKAGLCGVYIGTVQNPPYTFLWTLREVPEIIHAGIREAVETVAVSGVQFHEHVEACVAKNIVEEAAELVDELRQLSPRAVLELSDTATLERMRFIVEHLSGEQRTALSYLLFHELGGKPRLLPMDGEPNLPAKPTLKQRQAWLHWYIWYLKMHRPEMQRALGGVPLVVVVADGDRMLTNKKTGQPADPLGPIHAPVWRVLGRQLNKHGHPIKDPESENRIAKSVGVSRDKLRSYPPIPIKIAPKVGPDGKVVVSYEYTGDDFLRAIEASSRKKPTKPEDS